MAREFSKQFYNSKEWKVVREAVLIRDHFMCVKCGASHPLEVHHKIHLSPKNIGDLSITLNMDNLITLCRDCHFEEHYPDKAEGHRKHDDILPEIIFDEDGTPRVECGSE